MPSIVAFCSRAANDANPPDGVKNSTSVRDIAVAVLAGLVLAALLFWPDFTVLDGADWLKMHVFYKEFYRAALLAGRLPLWNPYAGLGRPFLADVETATLYPLNLFYLTGAGPGLFLSLVFHLALAVAGGLRLSRRYGATGAAAWFGALGFALSAPLIARLQSGQVQVFDTLCWLPLATDLACGLVAAPSRRRVVASALVFTLMFLAGSPPFLWVCGWTILCFSLFHVRTARGLFALLGAAVLAAGMSALQLLPFLELVLEGNRPLDAASFALANPQRGMNWLSLLVSKPPGAFFYWEYNLYAGFPLALAAIAGATLIHHAHVRGLLVIAVLFALLALGPSGLVLPWLVEHLPGWSAVRLPSRYAIAVTLALALLASIALTRFSQAAIRRWPRFSPWICGAVLLVLLLNTLECARAPHERAARYASPALQLQETHVRDALTRAGLLRPATPPARVIGPVVHLRENSGMLYRFGTLWSFSNPALARVWDYLHAAAGVTPDPMDPVNLPDAVGLTPPELFTSAAVVAALDPTLNGLRRSAQPSARVAFYTSIEVVPSFRAANTALLRNPPRATTFVETAYASHVAQLAPASSHAAPAPHVATAEITHFSPERLSINVTSETPGVLVAAEAWYPGWQARVKDKPLPVIPVNGWMRGVVLPSGKHTVELIFRPRSLALGCAISAASCAILLALSLTARKLAPQTSS